LDWVLSFSSCKNNLKQHSVKPFGQSYETALPKGAEAKLPRDCWFPLEVPSLVSIHIKSLFEESFLPKQNETGCLCPSLKKAEEARAMKRTTIYEGFDPGKYGMIFCPDCGGSGKSFHDASGINVCKRCGGFGLIKKQDRSSNSDQEAPTEWLK